MKLAFFEVEDWQKEYLQKHLEHQLHHIDISFFGEPLSLANVKAVKDSNIISIFINSHIDKELVLKFKDLRMIATRSTGFDHIDLDACKKKKITVCFVPHYGDNTVAEHSFALMLTLSRKMYPSIARAKKADFSLDGLRGFDLKGKTLGVVGMGRIGQHMARIGRGFDMQVLGYDVYHDKALARQVGFSYAPLPVLLRNSDIISLHLPYNSQTHHIIHAGNIHTIKKGAYIINTARGGLIETGALVKALETGAISGAGLDVLEEESVIKEESHLLSKEFLKKHNLATVLQDHILMDRDNVIITPHNAFNSTEAVERILQTTMENIVAFFKHKSVNVVK